MTLTFCAVINDEGLHVYSCLCLWALALAERVAEGGLTSQVISTRRDETGQLLTALDNMNTSLRNIVSRVRDGSDAISAAPSQIAVGNQDLSARTEKQIGSLEQTASSMEELTSTIKNTADNTPQAMLVQPELAIETVGKSAKKPLAKSENDARNWTSF